MRLAAAVVDGECAVRLVALARQPQGDILDQFPQVVRGIREGKELGRILVNRALTLLHHYVVQVGGKYCQRKFTRSEIVTQLDDVVPGFPCRFHLRVILVR